jgi:transposase-like protein
MLELDFTNKEALIEAFDTEQKCVDHLEALRWNGVAISPFDSASKVYFCSKNTYKCRNSGKYFNVKTKTLFHNTKIDLQKWFFAIWLVSRQNKKINSVALCKELEITQKSAWYMIKRIHQYLNTSANTFENSKNMPLKTKIKVPSKVAAIEVIEEKDKLPLLQWLQLLKK